ncbi:alpha-ketoglutarate-dependent dioxygenase AlkB [Hyphobacterium sp.]|uniref:alpha-ketoglutarate-dependent dioxygenase AlkB n=1 Tax=Hyphobacterium sp. TaxID=2004662 RepID=UPI003BAD8A21
MAQETLPPGASLSSEIISTRKAEGLNDWIDAQPWRTDLKRRTQHYGWRYDYRARSVNAADYLGPLPDIFEPLLSLPALEAAFGRTPDQIISNEYLPGQGISAHVDCEPCFGRVIASLSLGSAAEMVFRHRVTGERRAAILEPRSLLILTGSARYDWTHEIPARKIDVIDGERIPRSRRISLTFRTVNRE